MNFEKIKRPELFQGHLKKRQYFEGWYFKHVTGDEGHTVAFIPGISLDGDDSHSFVQVIVSPDIRTYYFKYPVEAFQTTDNPFSVRVGESIFSLEGCRLALSNEETGFSIFGEIAFSELTPIQSSFWMPNIMGFFAYIPNMECNHGVVSMNHRLDGHLSIGHDLSLSFDGGRGYIEKDWGSSFPRAYVWLQGNHFEDGGTSFMCSIATIPFGLFSFRGFIANFSYEGIEYRFATYNGASLRHVLLESSRVSFRLVRGDTALLCEAVVHESGSLKAPDKGEMLRTIKEGLGGNITLTLERKGKPSVVLKSACAGIEIVAGVGGL